MSRYDAYLAMYGNEDFEKIRVSKVLLVGAGGIGCEILKNLVLSGFQQIHLIDLDTIDVSNLNRQFLFRPEHVGQSKAKVAAQAAMEFNPDARVTSHHANIKDKEFNTTYFSQFTLVLNALDNLEARRHVNRLCLAANVPLLDSGTTGYLGQVQPILKDKTECYECRAKATQKVYPICTIRSTPDKPVHCVVWAKELFKLILGQASESMLYEEDTEDAPSVYMKHTALLAAGDKGGGEVSPELLVSRGAALLGALYTEEIARCLEGKVYEKAKTVPQPIPAEAIAEGAAAALAVIRGAQARPSSQPDWDKRTWSAEESACELLICLREACVNNADIRGRMAFDKDVALPMCFVAAATNLRSRVFSIDLVNFHDCKGIAGNIIPAIATTNAIVSGVQVSQAIKMICRGVHSDEALAATRYVHLVREPNRKGMFLQPNPPDAPNAGCFVCSSSQVALLLDTHNATLALVLKALKTKLAFNQPNITVGSSIIYEEGEEADEDLQDNLLKILTDCCGGLGDGTILAVEDFTQKLEVQVVIRHVSAEELDAMGEGVKADGYRVDGKDEMEDRSRKLAAAAAAASSSSSSDKEANARVAVDLHLVDSSRHGRDMVRLEDDIAAFGDMQAASSSSSSSSWSSSSSAAVNDDGVICLGDEDEANPAPHPGTGTGTPTVAGSAGDRKRGRDEEEGVGDDHDSKRVVHELE